MCLLNPESWDLCLWNLESWALKSGIQLKESGIPLTILVPQPRSQGFSPHVKIWGPENEVAGSTDKESAIQYLESGLHGVESRIQDCLRFPIWDD